MLISTSHQSLSPETFNDNLKMTGKTGSTSSGYCSSPHDEGSDESFDGDKVDFLSGGSYKIWGDGNSEHIAHNILSQLFEDDRKSPTLLGGGGGATALNQPNHLGPTNKSIMDPGSSWYSSNSTPIIPNDHKSTQMNGGLPFAPLTPAQAFKDSESSYLDWSKAGSPRTSNVFSQSYNPNMSLVQTPTNYGIFTNSMTSPASTGFLGASGPQGPTSLQSQLPYNHLNTNQLSSNQRFQSLGSMGHQGSATNGSFSNSQHVNMPSHFNRPCTSDFLQQSILRRKITEQQQAHAHQNLLAAAAAGITDPSRCFTPPNRLYPTTNMLSLAHHKKINTMAFSSMDFNVPVQPQVSPDNKVLLTTIESCCSQLFQLNREQKQYEYKLSKLSKDFAKPKPPPAKRPFVFKLWLLLQDTETTQAMVVSFIDNMEKISVGGNLKQKGSIVKQLSNLDIICREILDLAQLIHMNQGKKEEPVRKLIQKLKVYYSYTQSIRSLLFTTVVSLSKELKLAA